jgi:DNA modification methylase
MKIETLQIKDLTPDPQNARQHDDKNLKAIQGSLKEFGQRKPIVITEAGVIVAGNGTVEAAKRLGWLEIQAVTVPGDWTPEQTKAFALADNRTAELAAWNTETLTAQLQELEEKGWEIAEFGFEVLDFPGEDKLIVEDDVPDSAPTRVSLNDVWKLGEHFVVCGDSTKKENWDKILDGEPSLVFTDPPYGIGYKAMRGGKEIANDGSHSEALAITKSALTIFSDVIAHFVCCDWRSLPTMVEAMEESGITPKACIVWDKMRRVQNLDRFAKQHEFVLYSGPYGGQKTVATDVWQIARDFDPDHPTPKPVELVAKAITSASKPSEVVVDPFAGSGSTLIACEQTGRKARVMELDPKYCDVIITRWETLTGQKAELLDSKTL